MSDITSFNRERLVKLMNLSTSSIDSEALSAVRIANAMLRKAGLTWEILLEEDALKAPKTRFSETPSRSTPPPQPAPKPTYEVDEDEVWGMISFIRANAYPEFDMAFVNDVEQKFEIYRRLTFKQVKALRNIFETIKRHAGRG